MTRIIVLGDSRVGKTTLMLIACRDRLPLNIYASTVLETFTLEGTRGPVATFDVLPGNATDSALQVCAAGADGVVVLYGCHVYDAKRWLNRLQARCSGLMGVPILVCCHGESIHPPGRRVCELLMEYPRAEHTQTCWSHRAGIKDCANRIVTRVKRDSPSPLTALI